MPKVLLQSLTFASLGDGFNGRMIEECLMKVHEDLAQRGDDPRPRKISISVVFKPDTNGRVDIDTEYAIKLPTLRPPGTQAKINENAGGFTFNPDCSENPDQTTAVDFLPGAEIK